MRPKVIKFWYQKIPLRTFVWHLKSLNHLSYAPQESCGGNQQGDLMASGSPHVPERSIPTRRSHGSWVSSSSSHVLNQNKYITILHKHVGWLKDLVRIWLKVFRLSSSKTPKAKQIWSHMSIKLVQIMKEELLGAQPRFVLPMMIWMLWWSEVLPKDGSSRSS